jgi:hypothetical protein
MRMWHLNDYTLDLTAGPGRAVAGRVFDLAWRFEFAKPGFCLLDAGGVDSHTLRSWMMSLKQQLSEVAVLRGGRPFTFGGLARFDQQETTKFHLDGAPNQSMLMLGYEPSSVHSRLFMADYARAAFDLGVTPQQFLHDYNPMYRRGEELLARYVAELPRPTDGHARILLVNNSRLPFTEARTNPLGVMHKAEVVNPTGAERRVVNSATLVVGGPDEIGRERQQEFLTTDRISQKVY